MKSTIAARRQSSLFGIVSNLGGGILLICVLFISGALAQSESGSASLEGTVKDQNGAVVQGATVTVKNTETNLTRTVATDSNGSFSVSVLPTAVFRSANKSFETKFFVIL